MSDPEKPHPIDVSQDNSPDEATAVEKKEVGVARTPSLTSSTAHESTNDGVDVEAANPGRSIDPDPYPPAIKVPVSKRRGFLGKFAILAEVENAYHYDRSKKWTITFIVALCGVSAPLASSIILPALDSITHDFNTTSFIATLSVAFYLLAMGIFPLWWSSLSEQFGRRTIYLVSYALFLLFSILCAISSSIGMFVAMRMLSGGAAASVQAVGAGTIADVWEPRERGKAMSYFYIGPLCGPLLAPILGGLLTEGLGWRSTLWFLSIYAGLMLFFVLFALPETTHPKAKPSDRAEAEVETSSQAERPSLSRTTTRQSMAVNTKKYLRWLRILFIDPLQVLGYLRFPAILLTVYYASITFGALYVLNVSLQYNFSRSPYNYSTIITGLVYFPGSFGYLIGSLFSGQWMDKIMRREAIKAERYDENGKLVFIPEDRMRENAYVGAIMYPLALIWYGWAVDKGVMWVGTLIPCFFFGIGTIIIFGMITTMLTEFMPGKSSAGVALNNLIRNIFSCTGALVATPLIDSMGNGWLFTMLGLITLMSTIVIWMIKVWGPGWRKTLEKNLQ